MQFSLPKNHDESVAAQSVHHRLGDIEHRRHGDGGINRVATFLEDLQAYLGRQRLAGRDHAMGEHRSEGDVNEKVSI